MQCSKISFFHSSWVHSCLFYFNITQKTIFMEDFIITKSPSTSNWHRPFSFSIFFFKHTVGLLNQIPALNRCNSITDITVGTKLKMRFSAVDQFSCHLCSHLLFIQCETALFWDIFTELATAGINTKWSKSVSPSILEPILTLPLRAALKGTIIVFNQLKL